MNEIELRNYVAQSGFSPDATITLLGKGEAHENYLYRDQKRRLVIRTIRNDRPQQSSFRNEFEMLSFVNAQGIEFAPQTELYDEDREIHIISFVEGQDTSIAELPMEFLPLFVKQLVHLEALSYETYRVFATTKKLPVREPESTTTQLQKFCDTWYQNIRNHAGDPYIDYVLKWLDSKFDYIKTASHEWPEQIRFVHGDLRWHPGGGNLRVSDTKLSFIDWEGACFLSSNRLEIADVVASIPKPEEENTDRVSTLIKLYAQITQQEVQSLTEQLLYSIRFSKFTDVLWCTDRMLQLKASGSETWHDYKTMNDYRLDAGNYYFLIDTLPT